MTEVTFVGGPLDGAVHERGRFPNCLAEDGVTALPAGTYRHRDDLYLHQLRVPGDGTTSHQYVHASLPLSTGDAR